MKGILDKYKKQNKQNSNPILNQIGDLEKIENQYITRTLETYEGN